jgi:hypothetical protein
MLLPVVLCSTLVLFQEHEYRYRKVFIVNVLFLFATGLSKNNFHNTKKKNISF